MRQTRHGKGNALAAGFAQVTGDIVVMFDADGSADPAEIPRFVDALVDGADFAKGSRFCPAAAAPTSRRFRRLGNKVLNAVMNAAFGTRFTDLCYGYNAFWADCSRSSTCPTTSWSTPREARRCFGATASRSRPSSTAGSPRPVCRSPRCRASSGTRIYGASNLRAIADGCRVLRTLRDRATPAPSARAPDDEAVRTASSRGPLWHHEPVVRIGMIATRCQPEIGGIESHVAEVAGRLAARGYDLEVLTTDRSGDLPKVERVDGYVVRRFRAYPASRDWYFSPGLFLAALRARYDVVHVQGIHTLVPPLAMIAAILRRTPFVLTFHTGGNSSAFRERARGTQFRFLAPLLRRARTG